jgi:CopG family transcriptional regulator, nickel-responsive regulator
MDSELQRFGVSMESALLERFDDLIAAKGYGSRSEAIRDLIRGFLVEEEWQAGKGPAVGTITLVYDHHLRDMADKLTDLQHGYHENIISVLHVHLDAHNCLETLVVRGDRTAIQRIADLVGSTKGVKHCKLVMTTAGGDL